jgi:hypothetical protein
MTCVSTVYRINREDLRLIAATDDDDGDYREATARQSFPFVGCTAYPTKVLRNLSEMGLCSQKMGLKYRLIRIFWGNANWRLARIEAESLPKAFGKVLASQ